MRTTILAYVIAGVGLALILAGAWDIYVFYNEHTLEVTLSDYGAAIRTIAGGLIMVGLAQALRLLYEISLRCAATESAVHATADHLVREVKAEITQTRA